MLIENGTNKIVGFHYLGPNAGEILQGMAVAVKAGATKEDLEDTIGIHPTTVLSKPYLACCLIDAVQAETMTMLGGAAIKGIKCET